MGEFLDFGITHRKDSYLIKAIGLAIKYKGNKSMQRGYRIGKPYWNQD